MPVISRAITQKVLLVAAILASTIFRSNADTISGSASDFEARFQTGGTIPAGGPYDSTASRTAGSLRVGFQSNFQITSVFFFQMPSLAGGQSINNASLTLGLLPDSATTSVTPAHNGDLVALGFTNIDPPGNSAGDSQSYFYLGQGANDASPGRALIQDNFLVPGDFIPNGGTATTRSTDALGNAALTGYINGLYSAPGFTPGSSYLVLRVNPDISGDTGTKRFTLASAENANAGLRPALNLSLTPVPEPSTIAFFGIGFGALALGWIKRIRR
jgi:hypothetical protein